TDGQVGPFGLGDDHRAGLIGEARADVNRNVELLAELDRSAVHDAGAKAGQLEHFVVADAGDAASLGHDARVGGVNAIDVRVNLAGVGAEDGCQSDGGSIAAAAAERGDVEVVVDALKAGGDDDIAVVERLAEASRFNRLDAGFAITGVRFYADLCAG